ncbi:transcription initiation at TATA-containing promoter protein [Elasticomyces elasticus]|nr:transcription initiation at TATA-containing promoter protein [Elasticomyces elasticus]
MDTEIAAATTPQEVGPVEQGVAIDAITNSDAALLPAHNEPLATNDDSFMGNASLDTTSFVSKDAPSTIEAAEPTPIEDVVDGIQPIADFIPKDAPNHSHPTPPPERPLDSSEVDADVPMTNGHVEAQSEGAADPSPAPVPEASPQPVQASSDSSLVRPREDDVDEGEERGAKRSRMEMHGQTEPEFADQPNAPPENAEQSDAPVVNEVQKDDMALPVAPNFYPDLAPPQHGLETIPRAQSIPPMEFARPAPQTDAKPSIEGGVSAPPAAPESKYSTEPMTEAQKRYFNDKMKNMKKTKHATLFLTPVDPVALNIPTYPETIKHPMDLSTMEAKLKNDQYRSPQDYANDFELIVNNCRTFNGEAHPVTQLCMSMKAYFDKTMETAPKPDQVAPAAKSSKRSSPAARAAPRPPRQPAAPPSMPVAQSEAFALPPSGVPQPRRESNGRPARAIKPPVNRDIPYAKPKRKEHQLELRFCEYVLGQLRSPKHAKLNIVFLMPVDPVALNIPNYHQIIKKPMDLSTMAQKLKQGQYGKASEFKADFHLMIQNCKEFNPPPNPVRDMGIQFERDFDQIWATKQKWERANKPQSARGTSASDDDSDGDDDDDGSDAPEDDKEQTIQALQKQLLDMQSLLSGMGGGGSGNARPKSHKKRDRTKEKKRDRSGLSGASKSKSVSSRPAPKKASKPKQVSYEEKQEISEAVNRMDEAQVGELTKIITDNCDKYQGQDEMELEIDDLPNHVQLMLLKFVRRLFGKPKGADPMSPPDDGEMEDDDFEPSERARAGGAPAQKRKKHKPMSKREQNEKIEALSSKLEQFKQAGTSGSESPTGASNFNNQAGPESSGDDESEESEEE